MLLALYSVFINIFFSLRLVEHSFLLHPLEFLKAIGITIIADYLGISWYDLAFPDNDLVIFLAFTCTLVIDYLP